MTQPKLKPSEVIVGEGAASAMPGIATGLVYNPETIDFKTFIEMEDDAQIKAVLTIVKSPLQNVVWSISCEDKDIANFCTGVLAPLWGNLMRNLLNAINFGFQPFEKCWKKMGKFWIYDDFLDLYQGSITLLKDSKTQKFSGVQQQTLSKGTVTIPAEKSFVFTIDKRFGNLYGRSRLRSAYMYWFIDKYTYDFENQYFERYAIPILHGIAPAGVTQTGGDASNPTVENNITLLLNQLQALRNATSIVTPSDVDPVTKQRKWDIKILESQRRGADFTQRHNQLDQMKARAIFAPELVFSSPSAGSSYALAREHAVIFMGAEEAMLFEIKTHIDKYILPQLVLYNFGTKAPRAEWTYESISVETKNMMRDLVLAMVQGQIVRPDPDWITKALRIKLQEIQTPAKTPEEIIKEKEARTKISKLPAPKPTPIEEGRSYEREGSYPIEGRQGKIRRLQLPEGLLPQALMPPKAIIPQVEETIPAPEEEKNV